MSVTPLASIGKTPRLAQRNSRTEWINHSVKGEDRAYLEQRKRYFAGFIGTNKYRNVYSDPTRDNIHQSLGVGRDITNLIGGGLAVGALVGAASLGLGHLFPSLAPHLWRPAQTAIFGLAKTGGMIFGAGQLTKTGEALYDGYKVRKAEAQLSDRLDTNGFNKYQTFLNNYRGNRLDDIVGNYKALVEKNGGLDTFNVVKDYENIKGSNVVVEKEENDHLKISGSLLDRSEPNNFKIYENNDALKKAFQLAGDHREDPKEADFLALMNMPAKLVANANNFEKAKEINNKFDLEVPSINPGNPTNDEKTAYITKVNNKLVERSVNNYAARYSEGGKTLQKIVALAKKDADKIIAANLNNPLTPRQLFEKLRTTVYNKYAAYLLLSGNNDMAVHFTQYCKENLKDYKGSYESSIVEMKKFGDNLDLDIDDER